MTTNQTNSMYCLHSGIINQSGTKENNPADHKEPVHEITVSQNSRIIIIKRYEGTMINGHAILIPVISKSQAEMKQAVYFAAIAYNNHETARLLIKEALMFSWETGYLTAFAPDNDRAFSDCGFERCHRHVFSGDESHANLLYSNLSWDGINTIADDLIFPESFQHEFSHEAKNN